MPTQEPSLHQLWTEHAARYDAEQAAKAAQTSHPRPDPTPKNQRHDGWTPERQRTFLEAIADGYSTETACRVAGMSSSAAYAFKKRAAGQAFALGWRAAALLGRDRIADTMLARAIDGYTETVTRPNGDVIERHRFNNRLATSMLARLDRQAEAPEAATANAAARLVAAEFDAFLAVIDTDAPAARAGLFLASRGAADDAVAEPQSATTLARADRFARTGAALAAEVDVADLDPAARTGWTAEQWQRADAAGLVQVAGDSPLCPLHDDDAAAEADRDADPVPVWHDNQRGAWQTSFPPPAGFRGIETGKYGDHDYQRELTLAERAAVEGDAAAELAERRRADAARRDRWFRDAEENAAAIRASLAAESDEEDDDVLDADAPDQAAAPAEPCDAGPAALSPIESAEDDGDGPATASATDPAAAPLDRDTAQPVATVLPPLPSFQRMLALSIEAAEAGDLRL